MTATLSRLARRGRRRIHLRLVLYGAERRRPRRGRRQSRSQAPCPGRCCPWQRRRQHQHRPRLRCLRPSSTPNFFFRLPSWVHDRQALGRAPPPRVGDPVQENSRMAELTLRSGVGSRVDSEIDVKRSRFLCRLVRVETEDAARSVIEDARREHFSARHHCSAFILGTASAPDQVRRSNDDGEPSGTAGRPMLEALGGRGFIDTVAVVTRYFGGTLLGAGGLARAYSDAVSESIETATASRMLVKRERRELFTLSLPHADAGRIESELRQRGVTVLGTDYAASAVLSLTGGDDLHAVVASITAGASELSSAGAEWIDVELR